MAFSIKELEALSGIKAHTIRIWEQRYSFLKPSRTTTNIRTYSNDELKTLLTVALLNKYGYKISQIDEMEPGRRDAAVLLLPNNIAQLENKVNELVGCMIDLNHIEFEEILNRHIASVGLTDTITTLIFKFLEKVGILWQTNSINPAHEHIVSNIIRQKVIRGIDMLPMPQQKENKHLLFLPEDEYHEIGLLFIYFLLKQKGIPVIYIGSNVPLNDVSYLVQKIQPRSIYLHLTTFAAPTPLEKYLFQLSAKAQSSQIKISGLKTLTYQKKIPDNVVFLKTLEEVFAYINAL